MGACPTPCPARRRRCARSTRGSAGSPGRCRQALERHAIVECLIDAEMRQEVAQNAQQLAEQAVLRVPMSLDVRLELGQGARGPARESAAIAGRASDVRTTRPVRSISSRTVRLASRPAQICAMSPATKRSSKRWASAGIAQSVGDQVDRGRRVGRDDRQDILREQPHELVHVVPLLHAPGPGVPDDRAEAIDRRRHIGHGVEHERFRFVLGLLVGVAEAVDGRRAGASSIAPDVRPAT